MLIIILLTLSEQQQQCRLILLGEPKKCLSNVKAKPLAIPPCAGEVTWKCLLAAAMVHQGKDNGRLFDDQIILYGFDPFDALGNFSRFIGGLLRINGTVQLNDALVSFNTDFE